MTPALRSGSRVLIIHEMVGWIPGAVVGAVATVTRINSAGISLHVEGFGEWRCRYVPRHAAAACLKVLGKP